MNKTEALKAVRMTPAEFEEWSAADLRELADFELKHGTEGLYPVLHGKDLKLTQAFIKKAAKAYITLAELKS